MLRFLQKARHQLITDYILIRLLFRNSFVIHFMPSVYFNKKIFIFTFSFIVLGLGLFVFAKPAYRALQNWRAVQLIKKAQEEENNDNLRLAFEKAYTAYQLAPSNLDILRYTASITGKLSPVEALAFWIDLAKQTHQVDDLIATIKTALTVGNLYVAGEYLKQLQDIQPDDVQTLILQAQYLALNQDFDAAARVARQATLMPNAPSYTHEFYVKLSQLASRATLRMAGVQHLKELSLQPNQDGLEALRALSSYPGNTPEDIATIMEKIESHPESTSKDQVIALNLGEKIGRVNADYALAQTEILFANASIEDMIELGRFFNREGAYRKTAHCIPIEKAMQQYDLFLIWADAMAMTQQWDKLEKALNQPNVPVETFIKHLFLARVAEALNQKNKAKYEWNKAFFTASNNSDKLWFLVKYATQLERYDQAIEGLKKLTTQPNQAYRAWRAWLDICYLQGHTENLIDVLKQMSSVYPNDVAVQNDLRYAQALKGPLSEKAMYAAESAVANYPDVLAYRITLGLALLRANKPQIAYDLFKGLNIDWLNMPPRWRLVYAQILYDNNKKGLGDLILTQFPQQVAGLLPEEKELLKNRFSN